MRGKPPMIKRYPAMLQEVARWEFPMYQADSQAAKTYARKPLRLWLQLNGHEVYVRSRTAGEKQGED